MSPHPFHCPPLNLFVRALSTDIKNVHYGRRREAGAATVQSQQKTVAQMFTTVNIDPFVANFKARQVYLNSTIHTTQSAVVSGLSVS